MTTDPAKFTLRTETDLLKKFRFVADYNGRSANRELEIPMKKYIAEFEKQTGKLHLINLHYQKKAKQNPLLRLFR